MTEAPRLVKDLADTRVSSWYGYVMLHLTRAGLRVMSPTVLMKSVPIPRCGTQASGRHLPGGQARLLDFLPLPITSVNLAADRLTEGLSRVAPLWSIRRR